RSIIFSVLLFLFIILLSKSLIVIFPVHDGALHQITALHQRPAVPARMDPKYAGFKSFHEKSSLVNPDIFIMIRIRLFY
ncbi:MAG: hypothetical protein ACN6NI_07790, partial [Acinetobacter sp.]